MVASWSNKDLESKEQKINNILVLSRISLVLIRESHPSFIYVIHWSQQNLVSFHHPPYLLPAHSNTQTSELATVCHQYP